MTFIDEFEWDAYSTSSCSRFIQKDYRAFSSSGVENTLFLFSLTILLYWFYRIIKQLYSILISTKYLQLQQRAIHLNGMNRWINELKRLKKSHFNQILRIKRPISPIFLPRVRMLVDFKPKTIKITTDENGENVIEFKFDCKRTCFLTAHWGVPIDILDSVVNPSDSHYSITIGDDLYSSSSNPGFLNLFLRAFLPRFNHNNESLLVNEQDSSSECSSLSNKHGDITLLSSSNRNMESSSDPICFNPGTDHLVRLKPSSYTLDRIAQVTSNGGVNNDKIIGLVVVLYVPKDHETRNFTSGNIDTYSSYAQVTSININHKPSFRLKKNENDSSSLSCDIDKQIIFSTGIGPHEAKDMFGMGYKNDKECLICLAREMDTVLLPCCHSSFCSSCIRSLRQEKCPICRTNFASYVCFNLTPN